MKTGALPPARGWPFDGGTMGALIRAHDWAATPLGPKEGWSASLCTVVDLILDAPLGMIVLWGPDLVQIYNDCYAIIAAAKHPRALGQPTHDCWPETRDFHRPIYEAVLRGETRIFAEERLILERNGVPEEAWFDLTYSPVRDAGRIAGVLLTVIEVTERKRSEAALRLSEQRLAAIFSRAAAGLSEIDADGRFLAANDELCRILGRPREEVLRLSVADVTHPEDIAASVLAIADTLRTGGTAGLEKRYIRPDGSLVWGHSSVTLLRAGRESRFLVVTVDLTDRRRAEAALRESEARFRLMADAVPQIVWITDAQGVVEFLNRQWTDYTGDGGDRRPGSATVTEVLANVIHPDDAALTAERFVEAQRTSGTFLVEHRLRSKDGEYRWFLVRGVPYRDPGSGGVTRWFGTSTDIQDRKQAEALLQSSRDAAEEASRQKSRFLASVSHDLRQPVQAAGLFLELLKQQPLGPTERELLRPLSDSMTSLTGMLNGLLEVARLDAGLLTAQTRAFDLDGLLRRLYGEFQGLAREAKLRLHIPPASHTVQSDPLLVELVLRNLISNAIKYTEHGGVSVETRAEGNMLTIEVTDSGRGIPPEDLGRIFDDYYQIGNTARDHSRGFGIGLATVRRVAEMLGTSVAVRSTPGQGSAFSLTLPLAAGPEREREPGVPAPGAALTGRTALVVDDEPMVLKALEVTLRSWGVRVHAARTLTQARTILDGLDRPPDILIADYSLGGGETGAEAIAEVRRRGTPVTVLVTGDTSAERLAEARNSSSIMLHKPIDPAELEALLAEALAGR
ncbi:PAS domain S-box protein [Azospirillum sp. SYSU D00513]|uniref:PAS domain S-box protein n=1 Tax=Azospirillum sp. SYSU D00513 TaxID=2812561 RepID=UPI001FFECDD5|nr:PAS domain S-box protein [Azospirillum sp. SYSU D00513]